MFPGPKSVKWVGYITYPEEDQMEDGGVELGTERLNFDKCSRVVASFNQNHSKSYDSSPEHNKICKNRPALSSCFLISSSSILSLCCAPCDAIGESLSVWPRR